MSPRKMKRDEFSCPCCGDPTDSSYCAPCIEAECGERDVNDPTIETCLAESKPAAVKVISGIRFMGMLDDPELDNAVARGFPRIYDGTGPDRCPLCDSPKPELHPARTPGGNVDPCGHVWHKSTEEGRHRLHILNAGIAP